MTSADGAESVLRIAVPVETQRKFMTDNQGSGLDYCRLLRELLAVIHRDGGHRAVEVGDEQAWMEAMMTVPFLLQAKEEIAARDAAACTDSAAARIETLEAQLATYEAEMPVMWSDPANKGYPCVSRPMTPAEARRALEEYEKGWAEAENKLRALSEDRG